MHDNKSPREMKLDVHKYSLVLFCAAVRLSSVFLVRGFFVPDEYWQSLEVAHLHIFKYGAMTWEWEKKIRGFFYPCIMAIIYKLLDLLSLGDNDWLFINAPRIFQSLFVATCDAYMYRMAKKLFNQTAALFSLIIHISSWFVFYTASRTLTNTMEMCLTSIGLYYLCSYTQNKTQNLSDILTAFTFGGLSVIMRPTAAITWLPLAIHTACKLKVKVLIYLIIIGVAIAITSISIDSIFYGCFVIVPINFFQFNVVNNVAQFYGTHPWHWYLTQGLPAIAMPQILLLIPYLKIQSNRNSAHLLIIILNLIVYSSQSHKEFRFILPLLPIIHCYCGQGLAWFIKDSTTQTERNSHNSSIILCSFSKAISSLSLSGKGILTITVFSNIIAIVYFGLFHQVGTLRVMDYIKKKADNSTGDMDVMFLMPCHSTPFYSHVHRPISMRQLECHPPLAEHTIDEAEIFYSDPFKWLNKEYHSNDLLPLHLVMFDTLEEVLKLWLKDKKFTKGSEFYHQPFNNGKVGSNVVVYTLKNNFK